MSNTYTVVLIQLRPRGRALFNIFMNDRLLLGTNAVQANTIVKRLIPQGFAEEEVWAELINPALSTGRATATK